MSEDVDKAGYQQFNFEIALDKIETLTNHNNELLDKIDALETKLKEALANRATKSVATSKRYSTVSYEADAAMKRFTTKIRKELNKNAKSKQSQGEPV
jgi:hypothetical protein